MGDHSSQEGDHGSEIDFRNFDLKHKYHFSKKKAFRHSVKEFMVFLAVFFCCGLFNDYYIEPFVKSHREQDEIRDYLLIFICISFLLWLFKFIIELIRDEMDQYYVRSSMLHITKGIFMQETGSFPLSQITDVYLEQGNWDWVFGVYNLVISTPSKASIKFATLEGFDRPTVLALQDYFGHVTNRDAMNWNRIDGTKEKFFPKNDHGH